jgi:hypothetical protein
MTASYSSSDKRQKRILPVRFRRSTSTLPSVLSSIGRGHYYSTRVKTRQWHMKAVVRTRHK